MNYRYSKSNLYYTSQDKPYIGSKFYPNIPLSADDIYVITTIGDRLDLLAFKYYKDSTIWWVIAIANNNITKGSLYPIPGTQLRIPLNITEVLASISEFNQSR